MKPIKVMCPICGEEMIPLDWGKKRNTLLTMSGQVVPLPTKNYVSYTCSCGCTINYVGETDCWQGCKCKSCVKFQDHYPYEVEDDTT